MDLLKVFSVFEKVAELGSFSRAAENLGMAPSSISRQVNELEQWAGLRLINRTTRSLQLTTEGQLYLEKLDQIASQIQELKALGDIEHNLVGQVNLTAPIMLGQLVLPGVLVRFGQAHPGVNISVTLINRMVDIIEEGFDVAIRTGQLPDSTLISKPVGAVKTSTVASQSYLSKHGHPKRPDDLKDHNCLISQPSFGAMPWAFQVDNKQITVKVRGNMSANDWLCLKKLVLAGVGIARLPHYYVHEALKTQQLIEVLPEYVPAHMPVNIIHHSGRRARPALRAFVDFLADELRRESDILLQGLDHPSN